MNIATAHELYNHLLVCRYNPRNTHLIEQPKVLPCGNTVCLKCIVTNLQDTRQLNCLCCGRVHQINDHKQLPTNNIVDNLIKMNIKSANDTIIKKFKLQHEELKELFINKDQTVDRSFAGMIGHVREKSKEIQENVKQLESELIGNLMLKRKQIKNDLDNLQKKSMAKLLGFEKFMHKLENNYGGSKQREASSRPGSASSKLSRTARNDDNDSSTIDTSQITREELIECEKYMKDIKEINGIFNSCLSKVSIKEGEWVAKPSLICKLVESSSSLDLDAIQIAVPRVVDFTEGPCGLCVIDYDNLLVAAHDTSELILCDKNLNKTNLRVRQIGEYKLQSPVGICTDNEVNENIYVCDYYNDRVMVLDKSLKLIKRVLSKDFDQPVDCAYRSGRLFVIEKRSKNVKIFDHDGDFIEAKRLWAERERRPRKSNPYYGDSSDDEDQIKQRLMVRAPVRISACDTVVGVIDDWSTLYLYNMEIELQQVIKPDKGLTTIYSLCFIGRTLLTHSKRGKLFAYKTGVDDPEDDSYYQLVYARDLPDDGCGASHMIPFKDHLVISFYENKRLIYL